MALTRQEFALLGKTSFRYKMNVGLKPGEYTVAIPLRDVSPTRRGPPSRTSGSSECCRAIRASRRCEARGSSLERTPLPQLWVDRSLPAEKAAELWLVRIDLERLAELELRLTLAAETEEREAGGGVRHRVGGLDCRGGAEVL